MAAAKKPAAPRKTAAAKKTLRVAKPKAPAKEAAPAAPKAAGAKGLLRAGLKALDDVRNDVVKRQTNVIESLLGIKAPDKGDAAPTRGFTGLDNFGIRKFEEVFDQRVATSLQRLGMPSAQEIQALREQMAKLLEHFERTERPEPGRRRKR
jgi:hypothetical protein